MSALAKRKFAKVRKLQHLQKLNYYELAFYLRFVESAFSFSFV